MLKKSLKVWLSNAFLIWIGFMFFYGITHGKKGSPLYNSPKQEMICDFIIFPIIALLWPLWAYLVSKISRPNKAANEHEAEK